MNSQGDGNTCKRCRVVWPTNLVKCPRDGMSLIPMAPEAPRPEHLSKSEWRASFRARNGAASFNPRG